MLHTGKYFYDLDHVVLSNGKIYRVLGNLQNEAYFFGYNVYAPDGNGDRIYQGQRYRKNFLEDEHLPQDVLETYEVLPRCEVALHLDPIQSAREMCFSFRQTIWFHLYEALIALCGEDAVGIFGSSMFLFHLTSQGQVRKDVDFVIEGIEHVASLQRALPEMRRTLGFQEISEARQLQQYQRYQHVFQNERNTIQEIIRRRWSGLQLSEQIVSTLRFREKSSVLPFELVQSPMVMQRNKMVVGKVSDAEMSNLFPRMFTLETETGPYPVYIFWWKLSTPVRPDDEISICGDSILLEGREVIRLTNFRTHWIAIER